MTLNRVESGEIFQTTFLFFYFVPQCNLSKLQRLLALDNTKNIILMQLVLITAEEMLIVS